MTEYDYSPDAYERYMATQDSVSRWVDRQLHYTREYKNPFINPSVVDDTPAPSRHSSSGHRERDRGFSSRHGSTSPTYSSRPPPSRSHTTPVPIVTNSSAAYQPQPRVVSPSSRYQHPRHASYSTQNVYQPQPQYQYPTPQVVYISSGSGQKSAITKTKTITMDPNAGELYLPRPRRGEQYVVIPPEGRTVQVYHEHSDGSRSSTTSRSSSRSPRSPSKKNEPLLKRLFHLGGPGGQKPRSSETSSSRRQRRLSY